jgi:membrane associated rhomboid family serine protease
MIPLGDDNTDRHITPFVNYLILAINIIVFIFLQKMGADYEFTMGHAAVPAEILGGKDIVTSSQELKDAVTGQEYTLPGLQPSPSPVWLTLITSIFMHGGWAHLGGNMLYLWIFGDNLENTLGHLRYLAFYLLTGIIASLAYVFSTYLLGDDPLVPSLGASGAISGVLGGYISLFPMKRVTVLIFWFITHVPAIIVLGLWIVLQVVSGFGALGEAATGGVAYSAHIGGFIAGLLLIRMFAPKIILKAGKRSADTYRN